LTVTISPDLSTSGGDTRAVRLRDACEKRADDRRGARRSTSPAVEGRVGAELARRGHRVGGVEASPPVRAPRGGAARGRGLGCGRYALRGRGLHDLDDLGAVVREVARVLEPGGRFCVAAFAAAGFVLEALREPVPRAEPLAERPRFARQRRVPHSCTCAR